MSTRSLLSLRWLRRVLLAVAVLGSWSAAQAAVYRGVWDPPYGYPFGDVSSGLGWRGSADFFVPESCELSGSGFVDNFGNLPLVPGNCGGQAAITGAVVELYNVATPGQPTLATLEFNSPGDMTALVLRYVNGALTGVWSDPFDQPLNLVNPPEDLSSVNVGSNVSFSLYFGLDFLPHLAWGFCSGSDFTAAANNDYYNHEHCYILGTNSTRQGFQPDFTITRVPEPASLGLVGVALISAVTVGVRRRRLDA